LFLEGESLTILNSNVKGSRDTREKELDAKEVAVVLVAKLGATVLYTNELRKVNNAN